MTGTLNKEEYLCKEGTWKIKGEYGLREGRRRQEEGEKRINRKKEEIEMDQLSKGKGAQRKFMYVKEIFEKEEVQMDWGWSVEGRI